MPNGPLGEVEGATTNEPKGMTCTVDASAIDLIWMFLQTLNVTHPMTPKQIDISQLASGKLT